MKSLIPALIPEFVVCLLLAVSATAHAQSVVANTNPSTNINPMTGKNTSIEQLTRDYEHARLAAMIAAEELKRVNAQSEVDIVPERQKVERKRLANDLTPPPIMVVPRIDPNFLTPQTAQSTRKTPKAQSTDSPNQPIVSRPTPKLVGVMSQMGEQVALLENGEHSAMVRAGEAAFGMHIDKITPDAVFINGTRYARPQQQTTTPIVATDRDNTQLATQNGYSPLASEASLALPPLPLPIATPPPIPVVNAPVPGRSDSSYPLGH